MKKTSKTVISILVLSFLLVSGNLKIYGQSIELPNGLGISNQLEYAYDSQKDLEILENWLNLDYRNGIFSTGFRLDVFQPNDPNPSISRGKNRFADIAYKYVQADIGNKREGLQIRVGNYYALFGRGMLLKSYEDRSLRVDNNLMGVKLLANYSDFQLTALAGMPENADAERKDLIHAVDLEYRGIKKVKLGASVVSNLPQTEANARTTLASLRTATSLWNFDFYGEYGIKKNNQIEETVFGGNESIVGNAFYGNLNFYYGPFSLTSEYKYYDNFALMSNDGTVIYNTPPAVRKDYQYILLNRHPSPLDQNNEQGFQLEASLNLSEDTYFSANYSETKTLNSGSYYQRIMSSNVIPRMQFKEFYVQGFHAWSKDVKTIVGFGYNEELSTNTKNITPILENRFYLDDMNTLKVILEHQQTTNNFSGEKKFDDVLVLEYLRSPKLSISFVTEMETTEPEEGRLVRKFWTFIQLGYQLGEHTDLSFLVGSRQAGNICIGGVCRYEPEFNGVELKMVTRLF